MRKFFCFLSAICLVFLMSVTVSAEDYDVELSVRESDSNGVFVDAFLGNEASVCGGKFILSFDGNSVICSDVDSEKFDVEICKDDDKVRIALANDECVSFSENESVFSVKLKPQSKESFDIQVETEYIIGEDFEKVELENGSTKITVDAINSAKSSRIIKEKSTDRIVEKDKSKTTKNSSDITQSESKNSFLPIQIAGKNVDYGLLLAVCALVVIAFLFGMGFKKYLSNKDNGD